MDISNSEVDKIFDYLVPSSLDLVCGDRVLVPFGNRKIEGFCIELTNESAVLNLKEIIKKLDKTPLIMPEMLELMKYMKEKFFIRYVDSLRLFIPSKLRGGRVSEQTREFLSISNEFSYNEMVESLPKRAKAQLAVLERLKFNGEFLSVLSTEYSVSAINSLVKQGYIIKQKVKCNRTPFKSVIGSESNVRLTQVQQKAMNDIFSSDRNIVLLHGVTGSGKTRVYIDCIRKVLNEGKTAIMLVPEISLTPQILRIFRGEFGDNVAMLHSGLSDGEKFDEWNRIYDGDAKVVVGARSAIFAPLVNVGIIIVDEEHDPSYSQESNPRFNTIDIADFRSKYNNAKVVLGSATPSIETFRRARLGMYGLAKMYERISSHGMPNIKIVDMAGELRSGNFGLFSYELKERIIDTVHKGNQVMIFLNRRGYASYMQCKKCGYIAKCTDCDISLTYHREDNELKCHYCGKRYKPLTTCPLCGSDSIRQGKIGTEKVVAELRELLGDDIGILRMDNDTTSTKSAYLDILGAFKEKEAQILVGTQMIAKGHDFPDVTLVGVLDADMSLYFSDYRATERTFQLITQVAGRCGRSEKEGEVIIQTYSPKHYIFNYVKNYDYVGFYDKEVNTREITSFPPFTTIVRILLSSQDEYKCINTAKNVYVSVKLLKESNIKDFVYLGAMKSPINKLQNKFRYQIVMRIKREKEGAILKNIHEIIDSVDKKNVSIFVEVNPQNMS